MTFGVVIPWRDGPGRAAPKRWVERRWEVLHPDADVITPGSPEGPFNIAAALNRGIDRTRADLVVLTGADVVLDPVDVLDALEAAAGGRWVMLAGQYHRLDRGASERLLRARPGVELCSFPGGGWISTKLGWGPIVAPRDLLAAVGYDERFRGWGGEDDAFGFAAETLAGPPIRLDRTAFMLWHHRRYRRAHPDYAANVELLEQYRDAHGDPVATRAIVSDRPPRPPCDFVTAGLRCDLPSGHEWREPHLTRR